MFSGDCIISHLDKPSLGVLACTFALRLVMLSVSRSVCINTSSIELCQIQLENIAYVALTWLHSSVHCSNVPSLLFMLTLPLAPAIFMLTFRVQWL